MGYEIAYILPALVKRFGRVDMQGAFTECKAFCVCERAIVFADVMKITNTDSLKKNCDSYKVILKKQDLDIGLVS